MELLVQQIASGLASGAIYACFALALVMVYQATDHVNFAQAEMAMFSTFGAWQFIQWGAPFWAAAAATIVLSFLGGMLIERVAFLPLRAAAPLIHVVAFIALLSILHSAAGFIWDYTVRPFPSPFGTAPVLSGMVSTHQLGVAGVTAGLLAALYAFFRFTRLGLAMRGAAQNPASARLAGIRVGRMVALGWGMAAALGAIAGMLVAPIVFLEPNMMAGVLLYGFAAAVVGGLNSPLGAVVGGLGVGVVENLAGTYVPVVGAELRLPTALVLIVLVLVLRPNGLFGRPVAQRV